MRLVAVVLLATLLPSCLLVISLSLFSLILCIKLRKLRAEHKELQAQQLATADGPPKAVEQEPRPPVPAEIPPKKYLSDASNPNWRQDTETVMMLLTDHCVWEHRDVELAYHNPECEPVIGEILEALEFQGMTPAVIRQYLQNPETRFAITDHIATSIMLSKTSLNSKPESTLLPFSPEIQQDLQTFFKALEGIQFSPEFSRILLKFPCQIASEYGEVNKENLEKFIHLLKQLFLPLVRSECLGRGLTYPGFLQRAKLSNITEAVTLRLRMLGSRQQFEFRWDDTTETSFCYVPALYSHAGSDGVPLDEPKVWRETLSMKFDQDKWAVVSREKQMDEE